MSRQLILVLLLLLSSVSYGKNKGIFSTDLIPSTTKHTDPNEIITFTGKFTSESDFDFVNIEWKYEGNVEVISGQVKTTVDNVKANQPESEEINVRIKNVVGAKIIFWVYKDVDGSRIGKTHIYVPEIKSIDAKGFEKNKAKTFRIKSKKIFQ
ncbi:MAG: hypothetical protein A4S09_01720 [Proteobacteria bacterium SG_bin7]|nr:MAG: hypothetical protein A4S09_01720 [Proteobacteria bacterium SG_bin7]